MLGNAYVEGLGAFSKVTKLVRDVWTNAPVEAQQKPPRPPPPERPPPPKTEQNFETLQSLENGFENLLPDIQVRIQFASKVMQNAKRQIIVLHSLNHCPRAKR